MASFWQNLGNSFKGKKVRVAGGAILAVIIVMLVLFVLPIVGSFDINGSLSGSSATVGGGSSIIGVYGIQ